MAQRRHHLTPADRDEMVRQDIAERGVKDAAVIDAMRRVPREEFVSESLKEFAYGDRPLPIGRGQTISQPYTVAVMAEAAELTSAARVLEIGSGSGYAAAILSLIAAQVYAIERDDVLAREAEGRLKRLGYRNIAVRHGDGSGGWPEEAPFDSIIVSAGAPEVPGPLRDQLVSGGRLILPVGRSLDHQKLVRLRRTATGYEEENLGAVAFVPLVGRHGW